MSDTVSRAEAEHALGAAAEYDEDRIRVDDLLASGVEVGIAPESVRKALADAEDAKRVHKTLVITHRNYMIGIALGILAVSASVGVSAVAIAESQTNTLSEQYEAAVLADANVGLALRRRADVIAAYGLHPADSRADAEMAGARNRFYIAQRRYNEAAFRFNTSLASYRLGTSTHAALPLSIESETR